MGLSSLNEHSIWFSPSLLRGQELRQTPGIGCGFCSANHLRQTSGCEWNLGIGLFEAEHFNL
jgi:hypothetical protein